MQQDQIAEAARGKLAQDLGIPAQDLLIDAIEAADWPDPSLGIPMPGHMFAQVITPGYRIVLRHGTTCYEYRSNSDGSVIRYNPAA